MQRKQFGKRGVEQSVPQFGNRHASHAGAAMPAYAAAGGMPTYGDDDSFSIGKALGHGLGMFFSFQGRIGRMEYWTIGLIRWVLSMALLVALVMGAAPEMEMLAAQQQQGLSDDQAVLAFYSAIFSSTSGIIYSSLLLVLFVCYWSLEVRRSHDRGASGFFLLIMLIPIVGAFYAIWIFIANGFFAGTPGPNEYDSVRSQAHVFD
ncbi:DUF805 domain-containing protein [Roseibium sp. MMSF_3544]|uniref:DUF805 domain-containing protein n=1 Tax=unclassified Roseibium TaxID=2629323 RepID=UPI00273F4B6E|nr:DUF805 domain-containing protein [Roseibium sp. MMSF_3544]